MKSDPVGMEDIDDLLDDLVKYVYDTRGLGHQVDPRIIRKYASSYWEAVKEGFGKDLGQLADDSISHRMLSSIRNNVWQFSGAKNYAQLRALGNALIGSDGNLLSFSDFKKAAYAINAEHVGPWLKAEYELAVGGSQMAAKWYEAQESGVRMLEFDAVVDGHTTELCLSLNGVRKPIDHPFWDTYYPPNHYGERSTVRELNSGAETPDHTITLPEIPDLFRTNLAKQGLVFPTNHPYFKDLPEQVKTVSQNLSKKGKDGDGQQ